jgi:hypothetical protein
MANIRKQKPEDYVQQLISEEFTSKAKHLKPKQESENKISKKQKKILN